MKVNIKMFSSPGATVKTQPLLAALVSRFASPLAGAALLAGMVPGVALAGERTFAFSYGYSNVPKGGIEVEEYLTVHRFDAAHGDTADWEHQIELEYGISNRLEGGLYVVAGQAGAGPLAFEGYKARLKYAFGHEGVGPIDAAAYVEYISDATMTAHAVEAKAILGKDVGHLRSALNLEYKIELEDDEVVHEIEPTLGIGWSLAPACTVGAEAVAEVEFEGGEVVGPLMWAGPSVHLAGEGGRIWWTLAMLLPLNEDSRADHGVVGRSLIALNL